MNEAIELLAEQIFKYAHPDVPWNHLKYLQVITLEDKCIEFTKFLLSLRYPYPLCKGKGNDPKQADFTYSVNPCPVCGGTGQGGRILTVRPQNMPKIICLCGSTRFIETYNEWRKKLTYDGCIVLSIEIVTTQTKKDDPQFCNYDLKTMIDELHKRKIDLADEVFVLNVDGYIGESTRSEIEYAQKLGKPVKYLESGGKTIEEK